MRAGPSDLFSLFSLFRASSVLEHPVMSVHPLSPLSRAEFEAARDIVIRLHGPDRRLFFRCIYLHEPLKSELVSFLRAEHEGSLSDETSRPPRLAMVHYDVISPEAKELRHTQSIIDLGTSTETERITSGPEEQTSYSPYVCQFPPLHVT